jgi:hypothetical protein
MVKIYTKTELLASRLFNRDVHEVDADRFITMDGQAADFLDGEDLPSTPGSAPLTQRLRERATNGG